MKIPVTLSECFGSKYDNSKKQTNPCYTVCVSLVSERCKVLSEYEG